MFYDQLTKHLVLAAVLYAPMPIVHAKNLATLECLGDSVALHPSSNGPFIETTYSIGSETKTGWFLVDTGSNVSHLDYSAADPDVTGTRPNPDKMDFFEEMPFPKFTWNDYSKFSLPFKQMGIIGTPLLMSNVYTFDFTHRSLRRSHFESTCSDQQLIEAGYSALSTQGYFSDNLKTKKLFPLEIIKPSQENPKHLSVPNVPTVPVRVGEVTAVAQIDTGFDDKVHPFSVNVNLAFVNQVNEKEERLVIARDIHPGRLKTCVSGAFTTTTAYRLREGETFKFVSEDGSVARAYPNAIFFLKNVPAEALSCGGIGTWDIPAAQIGASFLKDFGVMILNANTQKVWIPKQTGIQTN